MKLSLQNTLTAVVATVALVSIAPSANAQLVFGASGGPLSTNTAPGGPSDLNPSLADATELFFDNPVMSLSNLFDFEDLGGAFVPLIMPTDIGTILSSFDFTAPVTTPFEFLRFGPDDRFTLSINSVSSELLANGSILNITGTSILDDTLDEFDTNVPGGESSYSFTVNQETFTGTISSSFSFGGTVPDEIDPEDIPESDIPVAAFLTLPLLAIAHKKAKKYMSK
ncbi:MAG: hypothetical protein WBM32_16395 [Crocosphaera sp.]